VFPPPRKVLFPRLGHRERLLLFFFSRGYKLESFIFRSQPDALFSRSKVISNGKIFPPAGRAYSPPRHPPFFPPSPQRREDVFLPKQTHSPFCFFPERTHGPLPSISPVSPVYHIPPTSGTWWKLRLFGFRLPANATPRSNFPHFALPPDSFFFNPHSPRTFPSWRIILFFFFPSQFLHDLNLCFPPVQLGLKFPYSGNRSFFPLCLCSHYFPTPPASSPTFFSRKGFPEVCSLHRPCLPKL